MKKFCIALAAVFILSTGYVCADTAKEQAKERKEAQKNRKEINKASEKDLNKKASKAARSEAKRLKKEGWKVAPGALPLEKQLDRAYLMQYEFNNDGTEKYIMGSAMSTGGNYDAAKMQALELAKQNLAGQIETKITTLVENTVGNDQGNEGDVTSVTRSLAASKNLITQNLGRVVPVVEAYREVGGKREVLVRIAYSMEDAKRVAKKEIKKDLEKRGDDLHNQLDSLLGW